jgi:hypothetical protein
MGGNISFFLFRFLFSCTSAFWAVDNSFFPRIIRHFSRVGVITIRSLEGLVGGKILRISQGKEGDAGAMAPAHGALPADEALGFKLEEGPPDLGQGEAGDPGELA